MSFLSNNLVPLPASDSPSEQEKRGRGRPPAGAKAPDYPTAKWEPKVLKQWHKDAIALMAQGLKREQVASMFNCHPQQITNILCSELGQAHLREIGRYMDVKMELLYGKVVDAIGDALDSGDHQDKLKAARLHLEATKRLGRANGHGDNTAEDVIARVLQIANNGGTVNVQVNVNGEAHGPRNAGALPAGSEQDPVG